MKRFFVFLLSCAALAAAPRAAQTSAAPSRTVYIMAMGNGLDQFLANRLAESHALEIVTDPKLADSVLTDRLGQPFERRMEEWFPAPEAKPAETADSSAAGVAAKAPPVGIMSSFGRGKGNIFLVDTHTRRVIWSTYEKPAGNSSRDLDRAAGRVAARMSKFLTAAPKADAPKAKAPKAKPEAAPKPAAPETKPAPPAKAAAPQAQTAAKPAPAK